MQYCNLQCKIGILGQCWHGFWTLFDPFGWLVAFFPTRMHVRRPLEAKKAIKNLTQKSPTPRLQDHCVPPKPKIFRNSETGQKKAYFLGTLEN